MDADAKDKELLFLRDRIFQLQTQVSILQKRIRKKEKNPRRRITEYFGVARSSLYRWLHKIDDVKKSPTSPGNKTPMEIATLAWEITKANVD